MPTRLKPVASWLDSRGSFEELVLEGGEYVKNLVVESTKSLAQCLCLSVVLV